MEGEKFSLFAKNYLRKRPRLSATTFGDDQMASTSTCMPSTSSTSNRRERVQRILIEPTDEQLLKWQERQISECIVENSVNQIVESYLTFIDGDNTNNETRNALEREAYHAFSRVQENFEDSAIVWAIDQYGLQQHNQQFFNDNPTESMSTSSSSISLSSPPHLPSQDDLMNYFKNAQDTNDETKSKSVTNTTTECSPDDETSEVRVNQVSVAHKQEEQQNESSSSSTEPQQSTVEQANNDEHFDFMEAAVAVAIQEKGLVSYSMQKSPNR